MTESAEELATKIWKTKGSRFNAHRRLLKRHRLSTLALALNSTYVILVGLMAVVLPDHAVPGGRIFLSLVTAFGGIVLLALTLVEHSQSYELKAERLHRSGMELNALYDELQTQRGSHDRPTLSNIAERYHKILQSVPENHQPGDYQLFRAQHADEFGVPTAKVWTTRIWEFLRIRFWYYAAIVGPPLLFAAYVIGGRHAGQG